MKNNFPQIKKDLKKFLTSEDGKVNRKDISQIALGVLALGIGLSGLAKPDPADAACGHGSHSSHGSHGSHGSHSAS